jgi:hypothetical protein
MLLGIVLGSWWCFRTSRGNWHWALHFFPDFLFFALDKVNCCFNTLYIDYFLARGAVKKKVTKVTYICRNPEKKVVTYFILFVCRFF